MKEIVIIGAGGHAKVIYDLIMELNEYDVVGIYDDNNVTNFYNLKYLGKIDKIDGKIDNYVIGIGDGEFRKEICDKFPNLNFPVLIHPRSIVSKRAVIKAGTVVCAGAVIQTEVEIGKQCIVNTNCNIDHESKIGNYCSISPGATICGRVNIDDLTFVGSNCTIIQTINIGSNCLIGAGAVILKHIPNDTKAVGNPQRFI